MYPVVSVFCLTISVPPLLIPFNCSSIQYPLTLYLGCYCTHHYRAHQMNGRFPLFQLPSLSFPVSLLFSFFLKLPILLPHSSFYFILFCIPSLYHIFSPFNMSQQCNFLGFKLPVLLSTTDKCMFSTPCSPSSCLCSNPHSSPLPSPFATHLDLTDSCTPLSDTGVCVIYHSVLVKFSPCLHLSLHPSINPIVCQIHN